MAYGQMHQQRRKAGPHPRSPCPKWGWQAQELPGGPCPGVKLAEKKMGSEEGRGTSNLETSRWPFRSWKN